MTLSTTFCGACGLNKIPEEDPFCRYCEKETESRSLKDETEAYWPVDDVPPRTDEDHD